MRVDHRTLPSQMLLDLIQGLFDKRADVAGLVGRCVVPKNDLVLFDDSAGRVEREGVGLRVEQLALALKWDADLDALARHHERAASVIDPAHGIVPDIDRHILVIGIPLVSLQRDRRYAVFLNQVALQVLGRCIKQPVFVESFKLLLHPLQG